MKSLRYIFLLFCLPLHVFAQGGYKLVGVVQDAEAQPIPFATLSLWAQGQTSPHKAVNADDKGAFTIEQIAAGTYSLKIESIGYTTQELPLTFDGNSLPTTVQNVAMKTDAKELKNVVVEGKKEFIETTPDATIIRPDANPTTQGTTATDVLQQTPNVQIDASGNISMRGGRPNIMVNGRMSGFGDGRRGGGGGGMGMNPLDQINAEDIESITISTNPSARFDAEGGGGLIDVRLKRDRQLGTHGMIGGGVGVPRGRVMGNARINHRTKKTNMFLGYGGRIDNRLGTGETERKTLNLDQTLRQFLDQDQVTANHGVNHNIRLGGDYYFAEKTTFGVEASYGLRDGLSNDYLKSAFTNDFTTNNVDSLTYQLNNSKSLSKTLEYSAIFHHEFKKPKQELNASFTQIFAQDDNNNALNIQHLWNDMSERALPTQRNNFSGNQNTITTGQIDFSTPHGKKGMLEVGGKFTMRDLTTDSYVENFSQGAWTKNVFLSNVFKFTEGVQAGYVAYRNSAGKWDFSMGLRAENVLMSGNVVAVENTDFRKTFFNLFPTARIAYNINQDQFIKVSFARRISRPNFGDLNPFVDISNPLSYRTGNPNINPEFMYNFELGYNRIWDNFTFSPTVFYRIRTNVVQRITTLDAATGISFSMPENIGTGNSYGAELTGTARFTKWWDMNLSYTFFQNDIIADQSNKGVNSSVNSSNVRMNTTFTFWENARLSFNAMYNSPTAIAQGTILPMYGVGMGFQKPLDKERKMSIGVNIRDMFYTMRFGSETQSSNFSQTSSVQRDSRVVMMNFRYRF